MEKTKPCPVCRAEMVFSQGLSKTKTLPDGSPKPWAKWQCTENREHVEWVNQNTRPYPANSFPSKEPVRTVAPEHKATDREALVFIRDYLNKVLNGQEN